MEETYFGTRRGQSGSTCCRHSSLRAFVLVDQVVDLLSALVVAGARPRALGAELSREHTPGADELAGKGVSEEIRHTNGHFENFRLSFDGATAAPTSTGGTGWLLKDAKSRHRCYAREHDGSGEGRA